MRFASGYKEVAFDHVGNCLHILSSLHCLRPRRATSGYAFEKLVIRSTRKSCADFVAVKHVKMSPWWDMQPPAPRSVRRLM